MLSIQKRVTEELITFDSKASPDSILEDDYFEARYRSITSLQDLVLERLDVLEKDPSSKPFCRVVDVPESVYDQLQEPGLTGGRLFYDRRTRQLIVKLTPKYHTAFHLSLTNKISDKLTASGVSEYNIFPYGASSTEGHSASREGDSGLKPLPERAGGANCATLMVECVYSQRLSSLRPAAKWWLTETGVNVVILINVNVVQQSVFLEVWRRVAIDGFAVDDENWRATSEPRAVSSTTISHGARGFAASGCLSLRFSDVMIREPPRPGQEITLTEKELARWAWAIFRDMY